MADLCRVCFRPTTIQEDGCPCWGDGSPESELDCFRLGVAYRDAQLAAKSAALAAAEQQFAVFETLANHAHERTLWLHVTTFTDNRRAVWVEGGPEVSGHGSTVMAAAIDLATKLKLLDSDGAVKP